MKCIVGSGQRDIACERIAASLRHHVHLDPTGIGFGHHAARLEDHFLNVVLVDIVMLAGATAVDGHHVEPHPVVQEASIVRVAAVNAQTGALLSLVAAHILA